MDCSFKDVKKSKFSVSFNLKTCLVFFFRILILNIVNVLVFKDSQIKLRNGSVKSSMPRTFIPSITPIRAHLATYTLGKCVREHSRDTETCSWS